MERGSYEGKFKTVFVCEGQIDAISFYEVKQEAIAIGSTNGVNKLVRYLEKDNPYRYLHLLVLALDNDDAGRKAERELSRALDKICVRHYTSNILDGYKDANEALLKEPGEFWFRAVTAHTTCQIEPQPHQPGYTELFGGKSSLTGL